MLLFDSIGLNKQTLDQRCFNFIQLLAHSWVNDFQYNRRNESLTIDLSQKFITKICGRMKSIKSQLTGRFTRTKSVASYEYMLNILKNPTEIGTWTVKSGFLQPRLQIVCSKRIALYRLRTILNDFNK